MENNAGKISAILGGVAIVGIIVLSVITAPISVIIGGSCAIIGLSVASVWTGVSYFQGNNETLLPNACPTEQTPLLQTTNPIPMVHSAKKTIAQSTKIEARKTLFQSAQLLQLDPTTRDLAFDNYLKAAKLGEDESLTPLEFLAEDMNSQQQLKLSQFYGAFLKNEEKANYWQKKGIETQQFQLSK